jgi:hypothetical protein
MGTAAVTKVSDGGGTNSVNLRIVRGDRPVVELSTEKLPAAQAQTVLAALEGARQLASLTGNGDNRWDPSIEFDVGPARYHTTGLSDFATIAQREATPVDSRILQQQAIIREHIIHERAKNWRGVEGTFTPNQKTAFYDVTPFHTRFKGMRQDGESGDLGVMDFYQMFAKSFPTFGIQEIRQIDTPGYSVLEVNITGPHSGEAYCGIAPQDPPVEITLPLIALFIFDEKAGKMELLAERIYFDNATVLAQLKGELPRTAVFDLSQLEDHL